MSKPPTEKRAPAHFKGGRYIRLNMRCTPDVYQKLTELAKRKSITRSDIFERLVLDAYCRKEGVKVEKGDC